MIFHVNFIFARELVKMERITAIRVLRASFGACVPGLRECKNIVDTLFEQKETLLNTTNYEESITIRL